MTNEEKKLLLKDLCARLPYGVKVKYVIPSLLVCIRNDRDGIKIITEGTYDEHVYNIEDIKPYLRPLSTMTEEEKQKMSDGSALAIEPALNNITGYCPETMAYNAFNIDFCLSRHLDYRGLIEKGLALEAPEGMYKID